MAQIIKTTGEIVDITPKNGTDFTLEEMQSIVGGWIEIQNLNNGRKMVVDEEGKLKGKDINIIATNCYREQVSPFDCVVGDVLLCNSNEIK